MHYIYVQVPLVDVLYNITYMNYSRVPIFGVFNKQYLGLVQNFHLFSPCAHVARQSVCGPRWRALGRVNFGDVDDVFDSCRLQIDLISQSSTKS